MGTWASKPGWTSPGSRLPRNPGTRSVGQAGAEFGPWASERHSRCSCESEGGQCVEEEEQPELPASHPHARL